MRAWSDVFRERPISALLATWFGVGFLPLVPGTWGSLAAIPVVAFLYHVSGLLGILAFIAVTGVGGILWTHGAAQARGVKDPSEIVVDEVAGQSIALFGVYAFCPVDTRSVAFIGAVAAVFVLFRVVDVVKPGPVGRLEELPGGLGIMADDLLGGLLVSLLASGLLLLLFRR